MERIFFWSLLLAAFVAGGTFLLFQLDIVVVRNPFSLLQRSESLKNASQCKQPITLYYWNEDHENSEPVFVVWDSNQVKNVNRLLSAWIDMLHNEQLVDRKVIVESASFSSEECSLYISFSDFLFSHVFSTYAKWHMIECLLKTIKKALPSVTEVFFLVNHQPMMDSHLDFSQGWPIDGFIVEEL